MAWKCSDRALTAEAEGTVLFSEENCFEHPSLADAHLSHPSRGGLMRMATERGKKIVLVVNFLEELKREKESNCRMFPLLTLLFFWGQIDTFLNCFEIILCLFVLQTDAWE